MPEHLDGLIEQIFTTVGEMEMIEKLADYILRQHRGDLRPDITATKKQDYIVHFTSALNEELV